MKIKTEEAYQEFIKSNVSKMFDKVLESTPLALQKDYLQAIIEAAIERYKELEFKEQNVFPEFFNAMTEYNKKLLFKQDNKSND